MTTLQKFQELANINFVEYNGDIEIGTINTADGYELHYVTSYDNLQNLNFENEVFYYKPDFDAIMNAIDDLRYAGEEVKVSCFDVDDYFDEYYMLEFISDHVSEEEFEKFTENAQSLAIISA